MTRNLTRRNMLFGLGGALVAAPFAVRSGVLMTVKSPVSSWGVGTPTLIKPYQDAFSLAHVEKLRKMLRRNAVIPSAYMGEEPAYVSHMRTNG